MSQRIAHETTDNVPLLSLSNLSVGFASLGRQIPAVEDVSLTLEAGEILAVVGESGSGKSVTAMAILGLLPENARIGGSITVDGAEVTTMTKQQLHHLRARDVSVIFQNPLAALNPVYSIGFQVIEAVRLSDKNISRSAARVRAIELLDAVGIPNPEARLRFYPHQLSGGQCQRVMIAMALSSQPRLLIADEPTTALDVTIQAEVLELLRDISSRLGTAVLFITHDMGVVADLADRVVVMRDGRVVETASVDNLFSRPKEHYTRALLAAVPRIRDHRPPTNDVNLINTTHQTEAGSGNSASPPLLIQDLVVEFPGHRGGSLVRAVDGVSLEIAGGSFLGLVGESGSGKSTISRAAIGAIQATSGYVEVLGINLLHATAANMQKVRRQIGVVFQNPTDSLNPRMTIGDSIAEPIRVHSPIPGKALKERVAELLDTVALPSGSAGRYPREFSGGQLQRVSIARAIALSPELLIADEPTSALDVSVQAQLLVMLKELHDHMGFACLFISHDLAVVDQMCDQIAVMHRGKIIEQGPPSQILGSPHEAYTRQLLAACLLPDPGQQRHRRSTAIHDATLSG